jgi:hypothetical protein
LRNVFLCAVSSLSLSLSLSPSLSRPRSCHLRQQPSLSRLGKGQTTRLHPTFIHKGLISGS